MVIVDESGTVLSRTTSIIKEMESVGDVATLPCPHGGVEYELERYHFHEIRVTHVEGVGGSIRAYPVDERPSSVALIGVEPDPWEQLPYILSLRSCPVAWAVVTTAAYVQELERSERTRVVRSLMLSFFALDGDVFEW